jgi:REP element-mobilizing transposase RayT
MIDDHTSAFLDQYFRRIAVQERVTIVALGLLKTHVHLVVRSEARYGGSSYAASRQVGNVLGLRWNREYCVTSVSPMPGQAASR